MEKLYDTFITGDETDYFRYVSFSSYQKFAEAASFAASKESGLVMQRMIDELDATWMTASLHLEICEDIFKTGPAEVFAGPMLVDRVLLTRQIELRRDGRPIARCDVNTMAVNYKTRKVIRPEILLEHFGVLIVPVEASQPRLVMPEDMDLRETIQIRYSDCDLNQHLRACRYTDFVCDVADYWSGKTRKKGRHLYIEYLGECKARQQLALYKKDDGNGGTYVKGIRDDGKESFRAYLVVE